MGRLFGTDGIRGIVNEGLDGELAFRVGQAAAIVLSRELHHKPLFTIGKDTRMSSDMFESAITAGLCSVGADVLQLGVVPTPAVAYITVDSGADAGIVISASHNPYEYNGIKIFNGKGFKLSDSLEEEIEELVLNGEKLSSGGCGDVGRKIGGRREHVQSYIEHVAQSSPWPIKPFKVIVDCSNGAASYTAPELFEKLGVEACFINNEPDGVNINYRCGSTDTLCLHKEVVARGADLGVAFDGDADRCIVVDELGNEVNGDKIMAICGTRMCAEGWLKHNTVVATVMSNIGFHRYADTHRMHVLCASVGDRNVLEMMQEHGCNLGGEQSGHIIFLDRATTGDGQLSAVYFLGAISGNDKPVSEQVSEIPYFPQVLLNVPIEGGNSVKDLIMADEEVHAAADLSQNKLGENGRILIRPSGTEALIRVMVEAETDELAYNIAEDLTKIIKNRANSIIC